MEVGNDNTSKGNSPTSAATTTSHNNSSNNEETLRKHLRSALQSLTRREPLEPTYKHLLTDGKVTRRRPTLPKDKFYKRVGSRLRERVEAFMEVTQGKDPLDRILQRQPLEEAAMRAALTLREAKEHEQQGLLDATLAALPKRNKQDEQDRRKELEAIAQSLQLREKTMSTKRSRRGQSPTMMNSSVGGDSMTSRSHQSQVGGGKSQTTTSKAQAQAAAVRRQEQQQQRQHQQQLEELERQRAQTRAREEARRRRDEEDKKRREEELENKRKMANHPETPQQQAHKMYFPIFKKLWDLEFANLGNTNPFRIVIDRENCASMGAPDYFDVITIPMNLTYIQNKVQKMEYENVKQFREDVELMIKNALLYNSDPNNPYRIAAEEMNKKYCKWFSKLHKAVQKKQKQQQLLQQQNQQK